MLGAGVSFFLAYFLFHDSFAHHAPVKYWNAGWRRNLDPEKPETWPCLPLWRRMIYPTVVFIVFMLVSGACVYHRGTILTVSLKIVSAFGLYALSMWGCYPKNPWLSGSALVKQYARGKSLNISRFWFLLPAFIAVILLVWAGADVPTDCALE